MNIEKLYQIKNIKVLVYGDYVLDQYINGNVNRISPEAPVPVLQVNKEEKKLGGCGNVINNIVSLGAKVRALGCIGDDEKGIYIVHNLKEKNVDISYLKLDKKIHTISKTRIVSKRQQFLRLDEEEKIEFSSTFLSFLKENKKLIFENIDTLVISDYDKGAVSYNIAQFLIDEANKRNIPIIIDPKGTNYSKYKNATICTPNVKELGVVMNRELNNEEAIEKASEELLNEINLDYLMLTRSEKGISLFNKNKDRKDFSTVAKEIIDVTGAGDTVVATLSVLLPLQINMEEICNLCNNTAAIVISKFGTSTVTLNELICNLNNTGELKYLNKELAKYVIASLKAEGKKIVFTNGCFDLLHIGHISSLKKAKQFGDILVVAVNSDQSVKENKGDLRPIINEENRIKMISELECVDYVILLEDKNPSNLIKILKPDISVKGNDWKGKVIPEKKVIEKYGGKMEYIEIEEDISTTKIIEKILKTYEKNE